MTEAASTAGRDPHGRFQPGQSGNPAGKKPGTRNVMTRFRLLLAEGDVDAAGRFIIQKAREGHFGACRFIIDHVDPKPRGRPIALDVAPEASLLDRYAALTRAMCGGEVSPQEAAAMARLLEREAQLRRAAPVARPADGAKPVTPPVPTPAPTPRGSAALDLQSAWIPPLRQPDAGRPEGLPDWRASVSRTALMAAASPASGLHPPVIGHAPGWNDGRRAA